MQKVANTSRFLIDLSLGRELADPESLTGRERLLQHIFASALARAANSRQLFNELGRGLIRLAEHAYSLRDATTLQDASQLLVNLPTANARQVGHYYQALATRQNGKIDEALSLLETVADNAPLVYRARAIQALGAIHHRQGRLGEALRFYPEALRLASREDERDLLTTLMVFLEISCIKSELGDHRGALANYELLSPLVRIVGRQNPLYFYLYHNELAIEFGEFGRITDAAATLSIALASPFASAYPEWAETRQELEATRTSATPSVVAISRAPETEPSPQTELQRKPHRSRPRLSVWLTRQDTFLQRPSITTAAIPIIASGQVTQRILDRVIICIAPRAPPALTWIQPQ
jgi:tetratricopeptide (TPR) repeat protein